MYLPCLRVLVRASAVPDKAADIDLSTQHAVATKRPAADRRVTPQPSIGRRDPLGVQGLGDRERALARGVVAVDALHDGRLDRVRLAQAALGLPVGTDAADHSVAIDHAARRPPLADAADQSAPRLVGEIGEEQRPHRPLEADGEGVELVLGESDEPDARTCASL